MRLPVFDHQRNHSGRRTTSSGAGTSAPVSSSLTLLILPITGDGMQRGDGNMPVREGLGYTAGDLSGSRKSLSTPWVCQSAQSSRGKSASVVKNDAVRREAC